ncbi:CDP-alcohol phosphatidyltransferase family protein [Acinetobacter puyangensis]|uniref:CDP-diacylglycerol--glycerol-3-phosphate 3-phosphatidyltransferase n=1 Tax=Acinetobacter puyangensis TaxID=1096779 RepID=A0A240EBA3_9GAMM|nr:CDP-alcohol phosphatidyltransferase family protein [Acinetobacter puyangensis]SNX45974.1 CDP-diacylglycerol--glycerol-3-phosphate 3-phosphatidyltransferase [Acinetobacter puyangensis]
MPSIYQLKPAFQNLLRPLVRGLYRCGITANMVTVMAMLISVGLAFWIYQHVQSPDGSIFYFLLLPVWMLLRMAMNAIDGMLAREFAQQSTLGAYLNELCDVISDTALYACFFAFTLIDQKLLALVILLSILSEYAGVMAPLVGAARRYDGPMGKSDRAFIFSLLAIVIAFIPSVMQKYPALNIDRLDNVINGLLLFILLLLLLTIFNRIRYGIQNSRKIDL